ncbi:MAG: hypothetical protein ABI134_31935 [Byssovorax sp.]
MPTSTRTPANGLTILANIKPEKAAELRANAASMAALPLHDLLRPLTLHFARWVLVNNDTQFLYIAIFDTDFEQYTEDAIKIFNDVGMGSLFLSLEGFPEDGMKNPEAFKQFVREHQNESFLEYSEYEGVTVKEVKQALKVEQAFSAMLDAMQ